MLQVLLPEVKGDISVISLPMVVSMDLHSHEIRSPCLGIVCSLKVRAGDVFQLVNRVSIALPLNRFRPIQKLLMTSLQMSTNFGQGKVQFENKRHHPCC